MWKILTTAELDLEPLYKLFIWTLTRISILNKKFSFAHEIAISASNNKCEKRALYY